jgi:hypothetical protein
MLVWVDGSTPWEYQVRQPIAIVIEAANTPADDFQDATQVGRFAVLESAIR